MTSKALMKTFRLWLEPDLEVPQFSRLKWELVDVPLRDVLLGGVHPWMGKEQHPTLVEAVLKRLNDESAKLDDVEPFGYCHDVSVLTNYYDGKKPRFEQALETIHKGVRFVGDLSYLELLAMAKQRLTEAWNHTVALDLLEQAYPRFEELRRFLKSKDAAVKLSGAADLGRYDLGRILALDDFEGRDRLVIAQAFPNLNLRRTTFLDMVTDSQGRLRLVPEINRLTLTAAVKDPDYVHLVWQTVRENGRWRFRPDIGKSQVKRAKAREFAAKWRTDEGRLCFAATIDRLVQMVQEKAVAPSFPALNYCLDMAGPRATAEMPADRIQTFRIGGFPRSRHRAQYLKEVLREYGVSMTGNKAVLLRKLAKLAAEQYEKRLPDMEGYFAEHRFVRMNAAPSESAQLPILEEVAHVRNLVLTMYALRHLRGNAILEASHENNTYTPEQLALALVAGKVELAGALLRVP